MFDGFNHFHMACPSIATVSHVTSLNSMQAAI